MTPKRVYINKRKSEDINEEEYEEDTRYRCTPKRRKVVDTPRCRLLKNIIKNTNKALRREKIKALKFKNIINSKNVIDISKYNFKSTSSKILTKMQLRKTKKNGRIEKKNCACRCIINLHQPINL